ncbi:hypothetical protein GN244_ATG05089 [Phytophthora infestans]|uniref:Uncharacterized protein n=1 Tax=Phytophthora infestans TaxID=4787 RepID=A0A833SLP8_PHYIN|nr:hypothetical protein GN244_ATG05089 [Phytophthora infestans]
MLNVMGSRRFPAPFQTYVNVVRAAAVIARGWLRVAKLLNEDLRFVATALRKPGPSRWKEHLSRFRSYYNRVATSAFTSIGLQKICLSTLPLGKLEDINKS